MNYNEFAERIKNKYPEYKDMENRELAQRMVEKYPQYNNITFDELQNNSKKGIDLTPSGLIKGTAQNIASALTAPIKAMQNNTSIPEAFRQNKEFLNNNAEQYTNHPVQDFATDMVVYSALPVVRGTGLAARGLTGAYQGGIIGGLESLKNQGDLSGISEGGVTGAALTTFLPPALQGLSNKIKNTIENPAFQKGTSKVLEALTSVPQKYSQRALDAELAGNSLFKGKFDPETAYIPVERKLRTAKNMLPTSEDFAKTYYELGQKATRGMNTIKENAGNKIQNVLQNLNDKEIKNNGIRNAVNSVINKFGEGGVYNSAKRNAPRVTNLLNEELSKEGLTLRDLHRIKEDLYDIGYQAAGAREGTQAEAARGTAEQINNYLRGVAPGYIQPNEQYSLITNIERGLDNENTIANKIRNIGSEQNILSGLDQRLKDIDTLLPKKSKFYKNAQETIASEEEINNIRNMIGRQYERNPRLLSNRNDEMFEQTLEDLQKRTNTNFMDELNDIRAREALENWFPGQGGGSGSQQGFGNLLRTSIIGGVPTAAALTHNPTALLGLLSVSPKFAAQGTIRNLGKIYRNTGKKIPESVKRLLTPLTVKTVSPLLYGGISNVDEEY